MLRNIRTRPIMKTDVDEINRWRWNYAEADLENPHGYVANGVETAVATKDDKPKAALTATLSVTLDPFSHDEDISELEVMQCLVQLENSLAYWAQKNGAVDIYIAVPEKNEHYQSILRSWGYKETVQNCKVFRRALIPDSEPLIGEIRDSIFRAKLASDKINSEESVEK